MIKKQTEINNLYFTLLKTPVFSIDYVNRFFGNISSSRSAIWRLTKKGLVVKIRNDLYTCISGETLTPVANRFQIGSAITPTSCISHHTAIEYYGMANQVYYEVYVSSDTPFREFQFDGYTYRRLPLKFKEGMLSPEYSGGIRITDLERTIIDSIKDMGKVGGLEETVAFLGSIEMVDEAKLLEYLELYDNQFLYQKCGYLLGKEGRLNVSAQFLEVCKEKMGKSRRYLSENQIDEIFVRDWQLIVPKNLYNMQNGVYDDDI